MLFSGIFGVFAMYYEGKLWELGDNGTCSISGSQIRTGTEILILPFSVLRLLRTDYKNVVFFGWYPYGYNKLHLLQMPINLLSIFRRYLSLINLGFLVTWWISPSRKSLSPFIYRIYSNKRPTSN